MFRISFITIVIAAALTAATACSRTTRLDAHWGQSYEAARQGQVLNPDAGTSKVQAAGLDGTAALNTLESYQKRFKGKASDKTVNVIKLR